MMKIIILILLIPFFILPAFAHTDSRMSDLDYNEISLSELKVELEIINQSIHDLEKINQTILDSDGVLEISNNRKHHTHVFATAKISDKSAGDIVGFDEISNTSNNRQHQTSTFTTIDKSHESVDYNSNFFLVISLSLLFSMAIMLMPHR